jgi:murein DD-endopeptidase MepM/ murein hydrolase activator NlpD
MDRKRFTLLLVPETPGDVKRFRVDLRLVKIGLAALVLMAVVFVFMGAATFVSVRNLAELRQLRQENQAHKEQLLIFSSRIETLRQTLDRVTEFDTKLRVITNAGDRPQTPAGAGGPTREDMAGLGLVDAENPLFEKIHRDLLELTEAARIEERSIQELSSFFQDQRSLLAATPSIWPTRGWVTSNFGTRRSPFTGAKVTHEGIDIAAATGTPIWAPANGVVTFAGRRGGYGKLITIDHGYGLTTRYAHLSEIHVKPGQLIRRRDRLGSVGSTGRSTGPHLHYEVRVNGLPVNPRRYFLD